MDVEDINEEKELYEIVTTPENFGEVCALIEKKGIEFDGQITLMPKNIVEVSKDSADKIVKLLELIEEQEDVQKVHSNFQIV